MENKQQDPALQAPAEANRDKHMNYLGAEDSDETSDTDNEETVESSRLKHDADSGSDGTSDVMLQKENLIDPGNEHRRNNADIDQLPRHDADSGGDASGTMGSDPGEGGK